MIKIEIIIFGEVNFRAYNDLLETHLAFYDIYYYNIFMPLSYDISLSNQEIAHLILRRINQYSTTSISNKTQLKTSFSSHKS